MQRGVPRVRRSHWGYFPRKLYHTHLGLTCRSQGRTSTQGRQRTEDRQGWMNPGVSKQKVPSGDFLGSPGVKGHLPMQGCRLDP